MAVPGFIHGNVSLLSGSVFHFRGHLSGEVPECHTHIGGCVPLFGLRVYQGHFRHLVDKIRLSTVLQEDSGTTGNKEGEVSDPPFFEAGTSRRSGPCSTPCDTSVKSGGVAHFSVTIALIPAGRRWRGPREGRTSDQLDRMVRMRERRRNLGLSRRRVAEVIRRRRTWCCSHCGYQGQLSHCPRCANPCEPLPSKKRKP